MLKDGAGTSVAAPPEWEQKKLDTILCRTAFKGLIYIKTKARRTLEGN